MRRRSSGIRQYSTVIHISRPWHLVQSRYLEATEAPEVVERFKSAVRGSLGSLGDRLIWAGFRPLCVLLALTAFMLGAGWFLVSAGFLILYNVGHIATRVWAMRFGLRHGKRLGEKLRGVPVDADSKDHAINASIPAWHMSGAASRRSSAARRTHAPPWAATAALAAGIGMHFGARCRMPVLVLAISAAALIGLLVGVVA